MINDVVLPDTVPEDWPGIRDGLRRRIQASMGTPPPDAETGPAEHEETKRYEREGLTFIELRYRVLGDEWNEGVCLLPEGGEKACPAPAVLTIHGTNARGRWHPIDDERPSRRYAVELARRGYVALSVDQTGFGAACLPDGYDATVAAFFKRYPDWSLDGRRLLEHRRALDVLEALPFVTNDGFGAIGISLGGRGVVYLAALDERIRAAVSACGVSPNVTNVFRSVTRQHTLSPALNEDLERTGRPRWEYQELLALCAPRALLLLEPYNDSPGCNPDVFPTIECACRAWAAYRLLECPEQFSILVHGEGHDTPDALRELGYRWFDRFLRAEPA